MVACNSRHDYVLKFLLVGDSDVGKDEILRGLIDDDPQQNGHGPPSIAVEQTSVGYKSTVILLDGKRVKLQLWDTSGQGRFSTILRSYSRGAQGVLLVYDITNRWSFEGMKRWLAEIDQHAPGIPRILVGNRLHLEFRRAVPRDTAAAFARKHGLAAYFEVSSLAGFHVAESLTQLARLVLRRSRMCWMTKSTTVSSLQDLCYRSIMTHLRTVHDVERLPLPPLLRTRLRSFCDHNLTPSPHSFVLRRSDSSRSSVVNYFKGHHHFPGAILAHCGSGGDASHPDDGRKSCTIS